ncbi:ribonuclease [Sphingomonas canadensis]|uniref:Ribonuclease n=1 Tax=Sphingomonas canadensis TaxID=1219257 RepID=A0ABW3HC85_9SPHN|nr:ribonuclease [Sphingomonas canadensis]MCW3838344.1 ribonuclease [Sphingomonas canadensis]
MAEWLYEAGIGEARAALVADGRILKARIELPGLRAGTIVQGRLRAEGRVEWPGGAALLDRVPPGTAEGAAITVRITREAIPEPGRAKLARAAVTADPPAGGPDLYARIAAGGIPVRTCRAHEPDLLEAAGWSEVLEEALTGEIPFPGGVLRMAVTPAMTLFDVDGSLPPEPLAIAAATAAAQAIERHGIGGSIGIDFPTLGGKAARQAVADAIDAALPQPFERTAVNGFGFLQIVRRRTRAALPELLSADRAGAEARAELRRIERLPPPLPDTHIVPARLLRRIAAEPGWTAALAQRMGRAPQLVEG